MAEWRARMQLHWRWINDRTFVTNIHYMQELGPFRVNSDGESLSLNPNSWVRHKKMLIFAEYYCQCNLFGVTSWVLVRLRN